MPETSDFCVNPREKPRVGARVLCLLCPVETASDRETAPSEAKTRKDNGRRGAKTPERKDRNRPAPSEPRPPPPPLFFIVNCILAAPHRYDNATTEPKTLIMIV